MVSRRSLILSLCAALVARPALADEPDFNQWLTGLRADALAQGIGAATLDRALANVAPIPHIIELDRRQPETALTFADYLDHVVTPRRQEDGRDRLHENRALLAEVAARYGVEPRFIVALWGIETDFGRNTGGYPVISALATLAYDGRRPAFFRGELLKALQIVDREHIDPRRMLGSWAGAMGQSQFMPSSFLNYAVSFRGDAPPDIWTSREDVFASIANYLSREGWRPGEGWGEPVGVPPGLDSPPGARRSLAEWAALGVTRVGGNRLPPRPIEAMLVAPGGPDGPAFLVFNNFHVILKWNSSSYFAIAVGFLADSIDRR